MLATIYSVAVDLPLYESAWYLAAAWFCRILFLMSSARAMPCANCGCGCICAVACSGGVAACEYQIVIPALTNNACANCADYSGTFVVTQDLPTRFGSNCEWSLDVTSTCNYNCGFASVCPMNLLLLTFDTDGSSFWQYAVQWTSTNIIGTVGLTPANRWRALHGTVQDCGFTAKPLAAITNSSACTNPAGDVEGTAL